MSQGKSKWSANFQLKRSQTKVIGRIRVKTPKSGIMFTYGHHRRRSKPDKRWLKTRPPPLLGLIYCHLRRSAARQLDQRLHVMSVSRCRHAFLFLIKNARWVMENGNEIHKLNIKFYERKLYNVCISDEGRYCYKMAPKFQVIMEIMPKHYASILRQMFSIYRRSFCGMLDISCSCSVINEKRDDTYQGSLLSRLQAALRQSYQLQTHIIQ